MFQDTNTDCAEGCHPIAGTPLSITESTHLLPSYLRVHSIAGHSPPPPSSRTAGHASAKLQMSHSCAAATVWNFDLFPKKVSVKAMLLACDSKVVAEIAAAVLEAAAAAGPRVADTVAEDNAIALHK